MSLRQDIARAREAFSRLQAVGASDPLAADPIALMERAGLDPDPWQRRVLQGGAMSTLLLCTRQGGKSTTTAGLALFTALYRPGSLTLLLSPSLRQSQELFLKVVSLYRAAGEPVPVDGLSALRMEFVHSSRIVALPGSEKTVRGFSGVDLLVIDEAARVLDDLYYSVRPMLAVSGGRLIGLTTPWGKRGWFYKEWTEGGPGWQRIRITAEECPRISKAFLEEERRRMPEAWFRSEYLCEFTDTIDAVFRTEDIDRAFSGTVKPLFGEPEHSTTPANGSLQRLAV